MAHRVFVFGTLKRGFPLHDEGLEGARYLGAYRTVASYPMVVADRWFAPMMFDETGEGSRVKGELYGVSDETLERLDVLESMLEPGNDRISAEVEPLGGGTSLAALVYVKRRELATSVHTGYLEDYQDRRFVHPSQDLEPTTTVLSGRLKRSHGS